MQSATDEQMTFTSSGIKGDKDRSRLEGDLAGIDGVRTVRVDPNEHTVQVVYDSATVDPNSIRVAVQNAGYTIDSQS